MSWFIKFIENLEVMGEKIGSSILLPLVMFINLIVTIVSLAQHWKETENSTAYFFNQYLSLFGIVFFWTVIGMIIITIIISLAAFTAEAIDSWRRKRLAKAELEVPKP